MSSVAAEAVHKQRSVIPRAPRFTDATEWTLPHRGARHHGAAGHANHSGPRFLVASSRRPADHSARRPARQRPVHVHGADASLDDARVAERGGLRRRVRHRRTRAHRARSFRGHMARTARDHAEGAPAASFSRAVLGIGMLIGVIAGFPIWGPRVQMVTFAFSALTLLLVERYLLRGGKAMWIMVPLFVLWSNLHGEFVIGLGFIAVILIAELDRWIPAHAGYRSALTPAAAPLPVARVRGGEHGQPQRPGHPVLRGRHAGIGCAAVAHRGVVLAELPRLGGVRLRSDAAHPRGADHLQPTHPRARRRRSWW